VVVVEAIAVAIAVRMPQNKGKLRARDLTQSRVRDLCRGQRVARRPTVMQQKTQRLVQFDAGQLTISAAIAWSSPEPSTSVRSMWIYTGASGDSNG
jgi:hypothetical protein